MSVRNLGGRFLWRLALPGVVALVPTLLPRAVFAADPCASSSDPLFHGACSAGQAITGLPADAANAAAGATAYVAEWALTKWVVDAAVWLLGQLGNVVFNSASPVLSADWFRAHYADMVAVAWVVAPLFLLLGVVQAIMRADLGVLGRIAAQLVVVAIFTLGAVAIAQMLVGSVDELSDFVSRNVQNDLRDFLTNTLAGTMTIALNTASMTQGGTEATPLAFVFLASVLIVVGSALIWLELLARTLVIYAALLFFPVLLATAIWPRLSHVLHRFVELLVAVIVSKFIIVVIVAAGVAAIRAMNGQGQGPSLLIGAGLLLLAAWAPWKFYRLLPLMEAGIMHHAAAPFQSGWHRFRTEGWRHTRNAANRTYRTGSPLPIAGRRPAAGAGAGAGAARGPAGGAATGGVAAAVGVATAGAKAAGRRAAGGGQGPVGGGQPRRPGGPGGPGAPTGWRTVRVAGGGNIHVPGGWVRNARPAGSGSWMRTPGANGGWMFTGGAPSTRPPGA
jgi:type IV secretion system protein TrbL